jgi:membrane-bound lytic murein transglycosylase B
MRITAPDTGRRGYQPRLFRTSQTRLMAACTFVCVFAFAATAAEKTPLASLAAVATALGGNRSSDALEYFDSHMKNYGEVEQKLDALTAQADNISCAIDIVTDEESDGVHKLDLDWFMQLKTQSGEVERRRERVQVEMRQFKGVWKITSISPLSIFEVISIR